MSPLADDAIGTSSPGPAAAPEGAASRFKPEPEAAPEVPDPPAQPPVEAGAPPLPLGGSASGSPARARMSLGQCHWLALADLRFHSEVPQR